MTDLHALTLDEILDGATLPTLTVPLCLNGELRREYEAAKGRIFERLQQEVAAEQAAAAARPAGDDRLGVKQPAPPAPGEAPAEGVDADPEQLDPEEPELQRILDEMRRYTVPFLLRALPAQRWSKLVEDNPPRTDPATGQRDPRDAEGVNVETFWPVTLRESIADPVVNEARWAKLQNVLTSAQMDKLIKAAKVLNRRDEDVPFSLSDLRSPQS